MELKNRTWRLSLGVLVAISAMLILSPYAVEAQNDLPAWVDNPSEQFSENQFLMAVGSSTSRQGAMNQAQANLAKIFVSDVKVDESYYQKFEENTSSGETTTEENTQLIMQSEVGSNQQMKNVQIKEVHEADNGTFYALAVMNRMETSQLYTEEIMRKNKAIKSLRQKAGQTNSKLERLIYTKQALTNAQMNQMLKNQRAILVGQSTQLDEINISEITQEFRKAKEECTVSLNGEEIPRQVQSAISRQLQNEGFTMVNNGDESVVKVNLNLMIEPVDLNRPNTEFMQWALQVEAQNQENGRWFSTYMAEGREGSTNKDYARRRAVQAVRKKINSEFPNFINNELLSIQ